MKMQLANHLSRNQSLITLINVILALLLVVASLFLLRYVVTTSLSSGKKISKINTKTPHKSEKHALQDYEVILRNNPFGFPGGDLRPLSSRITRSSSAEATLIGTVSGPKDFSYALFMNERGEQEVFRIGESVFGLGQLDRIEVTRAFIGQGALSREFLLKDIVPVEVVQPAYVPGPVQPGFSRKISPNTFSVDQRKIQQAIANPKDLMTDARLLPNLVEGKQEGFVVKEIKSGGIYQSLGLQDGDVLLSINDFDISNPENALQAFTALRGMERVQLNILRNGSRMTLTYQIQ